MRMKQQLKRSKRDTPRGTLQRLKYSIHKLHVGEGTNYGQPISKVSHWKASLDFNKVRQQLDMEWIHTDGILIVDTVQMPNTADAIKVLERACTKATNQVSQRRVEFRSEGNQFYWNILQIRGKLEGDDTISWTSWKETKSKSHNIPRTRLWNHSPVGRVYLRHESLR